MSKLHQSIRSAIINACINGGVDNPNTIKREVATAANEITVASIAGVKAHMTRSGIAYRTAKRTAKKNTPEPKGTRLC
jgi:hypothetical protein